METPIFLTALLLLAKGSEVIAQCLQSQSTPTLCATSCLQPAAQFSVPAILTPIIPRTEFTPAPSCQVAPSCQAAPSCTDYASYPCVPPPMPMPPVIIARDNDDDDFLLYFLLFALSRNRRGNFGYGCGGNGCSCGTNGCGGGYSCGGNCFSNCCGNYGNNLNSCGCDPIYFPYPIPCPTDSTSPCPSFSYPDNISSLLNCYQFPGFASPPCNGGSSEATIRLVISNDSQTAGPDVTPAGPVVTPAGPDVTPAGPDVKPPGPDVKPPGPDVKPVVADIKPSGP